MKRPLVRLILLYALVASAATFVWLAYEKSQHVLTVAFLDIGQGDSIFIQSPSGHQILIDGGADRRVLSKLSSVMPLFDRSIDVVIGTHPDKDHIGGLSYVFEKYHVKDIFDPGLVSTGTTYAFYENEIAQEISVEHAIYHQARRGDVIDLGEGAYLRILFPDRDMSGTNNDNNASVITQLVYGSTTVMLTGDSPQQMENYVVSLDGQTLDSDILKAGHHGSRTSSSEQFVAAVSPEYAIISAGCNNSYGHPHKETIETLERASSTILSTCERGTVVFKSDGQTWKLSR